MVTLLYSGGNTRDIASSLELASFDQKIRLLGSTEAAEFLAGNEKLNAILYKYFGDDPTIKGTKANQFLFGSIDEMGNRVPNGAWDNVSRRFAEAAVGEVRVLMDHASSNSILAKSELPALLDNPQVTRVEGIPINELRDLNSPSAVFSHLGIISRMNVRISGLEYVDNGNSYSVTPGDYLVPVHKRKNR